MIKQKNLIKIKYIENHFQAFHEMPGAQNQAFREMPGNFREIVNQGFREMPGFFRHFAKCLITQFACNIYTFSPYPLCH